MARSTNKDLIERDSAHWTDAKLAILPSVDSVAQRHAQLCFGWVAERLIATVLKTVNPKGFVGSTPTPASILGKWPSG